jgi:hypothetical protein
VPGPRPPYFPITNLGLSTRTCQGRDCGSDGDSVRACDTTPGVFPTYFPLPAQVVARVPLPVPRQRCPRLSPAAQLEIAARARNESLRDLAACYNVSHETIRSVVHRTTLR